MNAQFVGYEWNYTYIVFCGFNVDHPRHWSTLQWPGSKEVHISIAFPISHDRGRVCLVQSSSSVTIESLFADARPSTTFQWIFWGYSRAYSRTAIPFTGNLDNFGLRNVIAAPSAVLPATVFQLLLCACTVSNDQKSNCSCFHHLVSASTRQL